MSVWPKHAWHGTTEENMRCWCRPFLASFGLALHRPDPGFVFWEHGEQGPRVNVIIDVETAAHWGLDALGAYCDQRITFHEDVVDLGIVMRGVSIGADEIPRPFGATEDGE